MFRYLVYETSANLTFSDVYICKAIKITKKREVEYIKLDLGIANETTFNPSPRKLQALLQGAFFILKQITAYLITLTYVFKKLRFVIVYFKITLPVN